MTGKQFDKAETMLMLGGWIILLPYLIICFVAGDPDPRAWGSEQTLLFIAGMFAVGLSLWVVLAKHAVPK